MLEVITECTTGLMSEVQMSRVRDIMLGWAPRHKNFERDKQHTKFGCAKTQGYKQLEHIWMLLSSYLLYGVAPALLSEKVTVAFGGYGLCRKVAVTAAGRSFLANPVHTCMIRYPIELSAMAPRDVDLLFNPQSHVQSRLCAREGCTKSLHSGDLCHTHYVQEWRKTKRSKSAPLEETRNDCSFTSQAPQTPDPSSFITVSQPGALSVSALRCDVVVPVPRRAYPMMGRALDFNESQPVHTSTNVQASDTGRALDCDETQPSHTSTPVQESDTDSSDSSEHASSVDPDITKSLMQIQFYPGGQNSAAPEVHVIRPEDGVNPFFIGWALTEHRTSNMFSAGCKIRTVTCAGCLVCPHPDCAFTARPFSRSTASKTCGNVGLHGREVPQLTLQPCEAKFTYSTNYETGNVTLTATSHLPHERPPPKGPCPATMALIRAQMELSGKKSSSSQLLKNTGPIAQDAGAQDAIRLQRKISTMFSSMYGSDLGIGGLSVLGNILGGPFVRETQVAFGTEPDDNFDFIHCQLPEQIELTGEVAKAHNGSHSKTTSYLYGDVTYQFSTMYKMSMMTQSTESGKGVTLAEQLVSRLHSGAYKRMFLTFLKKNPLLWNVVNGNLVLLFDACLVDFSDSQRRGFIEAVEALWRLVCTNPWTEAVKRAFMLKLKGCYFHYCQSVTSCCKNSRVVPNGMEAEFKKLANTMYTATTMDQFNAAVTTLGQRFQRAGKWLSWWTAPAHAGLIFPAFRASQLGEDLKKFHNMPTTNNINESHNRKVNRFIAYREMPPVIAVHDAYKYAVMEIRELVAIRSGFVSLPNRSKQQRSRALSQLDQWDDGRAPQTTKELTGPVSGGAAAVSRNSSTSMTEEQRLAELHDGIRTGGLPANSIVQVRNDETNDDW